MSFEYQGFATLGVNLNRQKYGPLDISNVFTSVADLKYYTTKGAYTEGVSEYWTATVPYPYAGQYVALVNADRTVNTYVLTEREDGTFDYSEIGAKAPDVDGKTIIVNDENKLEAVIPAFEDTNTTYKLTMSKAEEGGTKLTLTPSEGEIQEIVLPDVDLSDYLTSADKTSLENAIDSKANAAEVYTKTETDSKIGTAIAAADHLKRKIVDTKEEINLDAADAMQYIYMVPTGVESDDNKYHEYIVLEDDGERYLEEVGNWEVDLSDYVTTSTLEGSYSTSKSIAATYVSKIDAAVYAKTADVEDTYLTKDDAATTYATIEKATALENVLNGKVDAVEGSALMTSAQSEKLAGIAEGAEVNFVKSVDQTKFNVTEEGLLQLLALKTSDVTGLDTQLSNLSSAIDTKVTAQDGYGLLSDSDKEKLNKLTITDGDLTISGSVEADQVNNLDEWITEKRDTVAGLFSTDNATALSDVTTKVSNLENLLNNYVTTETHNADIASVKAMLAWGVMNE